MTTIPPHEYVDLHPVYGSTSACGGGIGGQTITTHCAVTCQNPVHDEARVAWDEAFAQMRRLNDERGGQ